jgi:hypothetical protein
VLLSGKFSPPYFPIRQVPLSYLQSRARASPMPTATIELLSFASSWSIPLLAIHPAHPASNQLLQTTDDVGGALPARAQDCLPSLAAYSPHPLVVFPRSAARPTLSFGIAIHTRYGDIREPDNWLI